MAHATALQNAFAARLRTANKHETQGVRGLAPRRRPGAVPQPVSLVKVTPMMLPVGRDAAGEMMLV